MTQIIYIFLIICLTFKSDSGYAIAGPFLSPASASQPAYQTGGSNNFPDINTGLTLFFEHNYFTATHDTITYTSSSNNIANFYVTNSDDQQFGPEPLRNHKATITNLAASNQYHLFLTKADGTTTSRQSIWTDFKVEHFRWTSVTRNDLPSGSEFLETTFSLRWKVQQGRNEAKDGFNPHEIYSIRGLSKDPEVGVVVKLDYLKFDNLVIKWPIFEIDFSKFWPDYQQYMTFPLTFDLTNHPNLYFYLFKSRDIHKFNAAQSKIREHDIPTANYMKMKHVFCKDISDFECQSLEVSKPELTPWKVKIEWYYLPQTEFKGYLIPDCLDHCQMDESWIGCRASTEFVPKYSEFNSENLGDVKIPSKHNANAYNADGAIKWSDRQSDPIPVQMAKNSQNQVLQTTCYVLIQSDFIQDKYGYSHMIDIFQS